MPHMKNPKGGPFIENTHFWTLEESELRYIIKDAGEALKANPTADKAGFWADEINDAVTVLSRGQRRGRGVYRPLLRTVSGDLMVKPPRDAAEEVYVELLGDFQGLDPQATH